MPSRLRLRSVPSSTEPGLTVISPEQPQKVSRETAEAEQQQQQQQDKHDEQKRQSRSFGRISVRFR